MVPVRKTPHSAVFTRLRPTSDRGIGVFAIRDIPAGIDPFGGDSTPTVRFPVQEVDAIPDPDIRQLYVDFCPRVGDAFVAPADLNLLTASWYMNHADEPNVGSDLDANFATLRLIRKGEELTVDYTTFSDDALSHILAWKTER